MLWLICPPALAAVLNVPDDHDTLQEAIDAASDGDTIEIDVTVSKLEEAVVVSSGISLTIVADPVTTKWASGDELSPALMVTDGSDVTLQDVTIKQGNLYVDAATLTVQGIEMLGTAESFFAPGGGIGAIDATLVVEDSLFASTTSENGGGIFAVGGSVTVQDSRFKGSVALGKGGALFLHQVDEIDVHDNTFETTSAFIGGAIWVSDYTNTSDAAHLYRNVFCASSALGMEDLVPPQKGTGGIMHLQDVENARINNNILVSGSAVYGAGMYVEYGASVALEVHNNTFLVNGDVAGSGGSAALFEGVLPDFRNNIVFLNEAPSVTAVDFDLGAPIDFEYNLWGSSDDLGGDLAQYALPDTNLVGFDPLLVDFTDDDLCFTDAFYTEPYSIAIDHGDPEIDDADPIGGRSDIGAFGGPEAILPDQDSDGWADIYDCDEADPDVNPDAIEVCAGDGVDEDCDGFVDENLQTFVFLDADEDGYGDPTYYDGYCLGVEDPADGYVDNDGDCDDEDPEINAGVTEQCDDVDNDCDEVIDNGLTITYYADSDLDGYGSDLLAIETCEGQPSGYVLKHGDCDDNDATASPKVVEVCDDVDNDCDEDVDEDLELAQYPDDDGDGFGATDGGVLYDCHPIDGYTLDPGDCDDTDEDVGVATTWYRDGDDDGFGDPNTFTVACDKPADFYRKNGDDCDDSDGSILGVQTYYRDVDADGYGDEDVTTESCSLPYGYSSNADDCDDTTPYISPAGIEYCFDLTDSNCDGDDDIDAVDAQVWYPDADEDGFGVNDDDAGVQQCLRPEGSVTDRTDCDDEDAFINPDADETCDDVDNDCDFFVDDDDVDAVGLTAYSFDGDDDSYGAGEIRSACVPPTQNWVVAGEDLDLDGLDATDCNDDDSTTYPAADELCDDIDNDCDAEIDEDPSNPVDWYSDVDGDGVGTGVPTSACDRPDETYASINGDCDDADPAVGVCSGCGGCDARGSGAAWLGLWLGVPLVLRRRKGNADRA